MTKTADESEQRVKYIRKCMFCGAEMEKPLEVGNLLYKFCCLEHKNAWDDGRKTIQRLSEKDWS